MDTVEAIEKYQIELKPILGDIIINDDEIIEGEGELEGWTCFNCRDGGIWYSGATVHECVNQIVAEAEQ